jgi:predicted RNase H-like HicB family nuclease
MKNTEKRTIEATVEKTKNNYSAYIDLGQNECAVTTGNTLDELLTNIKGVVDFHLNRIEKHSDKKYVLSIDAKFIK